MFYWDLPHKKAIFVIILVLFVQQSTSKTKRSKKAPVEVQQKSSEDAFGTSLLGESSSAIPTSTHIDDLVLLGERTPDFDVTNGLCPRICKACDAVNGCVKCRSRAFLHVHHDPALNREVGRCVHDCPPGYFGARGKESVCKKCLVSNCAVCFTNNYCLTCMEGYILHDAKCVKRCPSGTEPDSENKKCVENVDCEVGAWSSWSNCALRSQKKSCKYGRKKRTRAILKEPTENGKQCPKLKESKRCRTPSNKCIMVNKLFQRQLRRKNKKNRKGKKQRKNRRNEIHSNDTMASRSSRGKHETMT